MAGRIRPLTWLERGGAIAALLVLITLLLPLAAVFVRADATAALGAADWRVIRFTLLQATLSALVSIIVAIPIARALARRSFFARSLFITLLGAPFLLPTIVVVLGLLAVFGRGGWINTVFDAVGLAQIEIYGLGGIVLAHVFLNLPLAVRLLFHGWQAIPAERMRVAATLGFSTRAMRRHFETPMVRATLPGAGALIFLICCTSFSIALILGGGPRSTTIEVAIYQAFRFDFDLGRAAMLGLVQVGICLAVGLALFGVRSHDVGGGLDRPPLSWPCDSLANRWFDRVILGIMAFFFITPLLAVATQGLAAIFQLPPQVWQAAARSVVVALSCAVGAVVLAVPFSTLIVRARGIFRPGIESIGFLALVLSPLVMGTGWFIVLFPVADPATLALPVTGLVNTLVALPFMVRALIPAIQTAEATQGRLAEALGLSEWARLRHVILPRIQRPLGFGAGVVAAFSMGDLGVITLFAVSGEGTLPLELYRLMGSYRTDDAQGAALVLMVLSLGLFWVFDRGGRLNVVHR